jgi:hypothetical protein
MSIHPESKSCSDIDRVLVLNRPISVYRFLRRALTLCPQLCMGIQSDARFPARSADALPATLYGHSTQAIYRNRPITLPPGETKEGVGGPGCGQQRVVGP